MLSCAHIAQHGTWLGRSANVAIVVEELPTLKSFDMHSALCSIGDGWSRAIDHMLDA